MKRGRPIRRGFTLIEVMIALVILTGSLLGMGAFMARFAHGTATSAAASLASDLAVARLETVKGSGNYDALEDDYEGSTPSVEHPTFTITTDVTRTKNESSDYTAVTVTVSAPTLQRDVKKTTIVSAF